MGDIANIKNLSASQLTGTLQTAAQPNITSLGTISSTLNIRGSTPLSCNNSLSSSTCSLSVDSVSGDQTFGSTTANKFHLRTNGNRKITIGSTGLQLDIIGSTALTNSLYQITDGTVIYQQWFDGTQCWLQTFSNHPLTFASNNGSVQIYEYIRFNFIWNTSNSCSAQYYIDWNFSDSYGYINYWNTSNSCSAKYYLSWNSNVIEYVRISNRYSNRKRAFV
ncbi:TPA: hypothetical protein N0F65_003093 [Lagenidium giganteum]|uniref:Uncharacterized protein n=1 Tax=Lagenidium giganteum TaxID=4803 RepID=A0AAV2YM80_9STRA|nr:TPA: hypothetical protein N0F65_003093 [Lagenidium giganteum]